MDEAVSRQILEASKTSMGMDTSEIDMLNIDAFAARCAVATEQRSPLQ
jgi:nucleolar protein 56